LDRRDYIRRDMGIGYCNITKCCTEVCPEEIHITDNAIIALKERLVDAHYDPIAWLGRKIVGRPAPLPAAKAREYTGAAHAQTPAAVPRGPGDPASAPHEPGSGG
jgi:succinate dehydrogenase / fumarate reductase iron-sulfur subunit